MDTVADLTETIARRSGEPLSRRTLKNAIRCSGIGLHSGAPATLTLKPADAGTGIVFVRTDVTDGRDPQVPARWDTVTETMLCTVVSNADGITVSTIEHLVAALAGAEIDDIVVEIDGPEVPIMDGSSAPFVFLVDCAGVQDAETPRRALRILRPVEVRDGDRIARLEPHDDTDFVLEFAFDFGCEAVGDQYAEIRFSRGAFKTELARARTFGRLEDVERLRAAGFARGGSLDNAIVVSGADVLNEGGLRFDDEFVRHKILDSVGDLYLAGAPIIGRFVADCSGHALNNALLRAVFADADNYRWETARRSPILPAAAPMMAEDKIAAQPA